MKRTSQLVQSGGGDAPSAGMIAGVGSVESQFMIQTVPAITDFTDPDLPAVMVYMECLCALEVRETCPGYMGIHSVFAIFWM